MTETRIATRRNLLKGGAISFGRDKITCAVRNISKTGARLEITRSIDLPDAFTLVIEMEHAERKCEVVWRKQNIVGVRFLL